MTISPRLVLIAWPIQARCLQGPDVVGPSFLCFIAPSSCLLILSPEAITVTVVDDVPSIDSGVDRGNAGFRKILDDNGARNETEDTGCVGCGCHVVVLAPVLGRLVVVVNVTNRGDFYSIAQS